MKYYVTKTNELKAENDSTLTEHERNYCYAFDTDETPILAEIVRVNNVTPFKKEAFIRTYVDEYVTNATDVQRERLFDAFQTRDFEQIMVRMLNYYHDVIEYGEPIVPFGNPTQNYECMFIDEIVRHTIEYR